MRPKCINVKTSVLYNLKTRESQLVVPMYSYEVTKFIPWKAIASISGKLCDNDFLFRCFLGHVTWISSIINGVSYELVHVTFGVLRLIKFLLCTLNVQRLFIYLFIYSFIHLNFVSLFVYFVYLFVYLFIISKLANKVRSLCFWAPDYVH